MSRLIKLSVFAALMTFLQMVALSLPAAAQNNPFIAPEKQQAPEAVRADEVYAQLPPDIQKMLIEETDFVHTYCQGQDMFASFHDCECVAAKFLDRRVLDYDPGLDPVTIADRVADQCPNAPGVAGYGYNQCVGLYGWQMPVGLESFCTCYGNSFSELYMKDPRSVIPNITGIGSASLLRCSEKIEPNPLQLRN